VEQGDGADRTTRPSVIGAPEGALAAWLAARGQPGFRARQVERWAWTRRAETFEVMSDLPKRLRDELAASWDVFATAVVHHDVAPDQTEKLLLRCPDGRNVECVLMAEDDRRTVCLSSQVGCGMGCVFCASGLKGVERNLTAGEIIEQALRLRNLLPAGSELTNIVIMGMGESLANLDNVVAALDRICDPATGLGLSQRRVTISTVGLPEKMLRLAAMGRQYHLAVSLHAPTPELRDELVPINAKVGLDAVMEAADAFFDATGRQVTFEYVLLRGVNDGPRHAQALAKLLEHRKAHVNLIPYNPVVGLPYERPDDDAIRSFVGTLRGRGVSATVRKTKGRPIDAACGQLRRRAEAAATDPTTSRAVSCS
jgi:23S rRNA (adenine2503-C2)-methyltransferase